MDDIAPASLDDVPPGDRALGPTPAVTDGPCALVDDVGRFVDDRDCVVYRTSQDAVAGLRALAEAGTALDQLWLDHDLGGGDTIRPVLALLEELALGGRPLRIGKAFVITSNPTGGHLIGGVLRRLGYHWERLCSLRGILTAYPATQSSVDTVRRQHPDR